MSDAIAATVLPLAPAAANIQAKADVPSGPPPLPAPEPASVTVDTPALGHVGAEVTRHADALHVHFAVDRSATAALITGGSDGLDRALNAAGARLDTVTVAVRGEASNFGEPRREAPSRREHPPHGAPPRPPRPPRAAVAAPADRFA